VVDEGEIRSNGSKEKKRVKLNWTIMKQEDRELVEPVEGLKGQFRKASQSLGKHKNHAAGDRLIGVVCVMGEARRRRCPRGSVGALRS
jgi:hypothetical protein